MPPRTAFAALVVFASLEMAAAQDDGVWTTAAGGSWASAGNWLDGIIADGADSTASFGFSLYPLNTNAAISLNGARTIGNLTFISQTNPASWTLNPGTGGPLTLNATLDFPAVTVNPAGLQVTIKAVLAGTDGLEKFGAGSLVLAATNSYVGGTVVSSGALLVNGRLTDTGAVTVVSGTLGGTGIISGPVTVQTGGMFSPGGAPGSFTISNTLTLQAGSKTWIDVNASTLAHDSVAGISTVNYGGTLTVSNLAGTPTLGQNFPIFSAASASGNFSSITPQLTGAVRWRFVPASGTLSVVSTNLQPKFASAFVSLKTNFVLSVTNGVPGFTNYLLTSTNVALPRPSWTRLATNIFDAGGNLTVTNAVNLPQRFFLISTAP